jgi:chromate transporter
VILVDETVMQVFLLFARFGLLSWGGGQVVLAEMQREMVARGWLTESQFLEAYAIGQMTPGPGALYIIPMGYQAAGVPGALAAAAGFMLPTAAITLTAILLWRRVRESAWPAAIRAALAPVALGLTLASVYTMGRSVLSDVTSVAIASASTLIFWRTPIPTPLVILGAGALGALALAR